MAKTYLGYGYTNENGVATLDFDAEDNPLPKKSYQCHSRTASVVAEASIDNVITSSNSIRFCEGYVPPTDTLSLTADKNILSYADNDTVTLTATFESADSVSGKSVVFKVGDTVLDTVTTDSEGVAEYTYNSQGRGDVTFTVECMNLIQTCSIRDAKFHTTDLSNFHNYQTEMLLSDYIAPTSGIIYLELTGDLQFVLGNNETSKSDDWCWVVQRTASIHISSYNSQVTTTYPTSNSFIIEYTPTSFKLTCNGVVKVNATGLMDTASRPHTLRLYKRTQANNLKSITVL